MIILRYLAKEILTTMLAVSSALLLIIVSGRFVRYLSEAASGKIEADVLGLLLLYRIPSFLELIIPLGFFIGVLLAYGRLYVDNEMTVLSASGMSEKQLLKYTLYTGLLVALVVGCLSLVISPLGVKQAESILAEQRSRTEFESLKPAKFHKLSSRDAVTYAQTLSTDKKTLESVFLAGLSDSGNQLSVLTSTTGETQINPANGKQYLVLNEGQQYTGLPGSNQYEVVSFKRYSQYLPEPAIEVRSKMKADMLQTSELLRVQGPEAQAALHWRLSLPVLVMIIAFLAVPLSRTQPRQGRYAKMIPAILIYIFYLVASNAARGAMEKGDFALPFALWWVHAAFLLLALFLFWLPSRKH